MTQTHTHTHTTHTHANAQTQMCTHKCAHTNARAHTNTPRTCAPTHTHIHSTHAHTHTHTHTHTHLRQVCPLDVRLLLQYLRHLVPRDAERQPIQAAVGRGLHKHRLVGDAQLQGLGQGRGGGESQAFWMATKRGPCVWTLWGAARAARCYCRAMPLSTLRLPQGGPPSQRSLEGKWGVTEGGHLLGRVCMARQLRGLADRR
jgi:hypothetical protein